MHTGRLAADRGRGPHRPTSWTDAARDLLLGSACVGCGSAGRLLCGRCAAGLPRHGSPAWPTPTPPGLAPPWAAGAYDGVLKAMVNQHKEAGAFALAGPLGRVLGDVVADLLRDVAAPGRGVLLVPVPSRRAVVRRRGHDPLLRVSRQAAARLRRCGRPAVVLQPLVARTPVADQAGLGALDRATNLAGSMRCRPGAWASRVGLDGSDLVLVDDVLTTGSTAREAQRAVEEAGLPVVGIATVAATRRWRSSVAAVG